MIKSTQAESLNKETLKIVKLLKNTMSIEEIQTYSSTMVFYRFISELSESDSDSWINIDDKNTFKKMIKSKESFDSSEVNRALKDISSSSSTFEGIFDDIDFTSKKMGKNDDERKEKGFEFLKCISSIDINLAESKIDVLGNLYEYIISGFTSDGGSSNGEFYTPQEVSSLLYRIASFEKDDIKSIYDPTCGSGSLLLGAVKQINSNESNIEVCGQEMSTHTYNLSRMNMMMHGRKPDDFKIYNGDTLEDDGFTGVRFDAILANPPYSVPWNHSDEVMKDPRFSDVKRLAPKGKADWAFIQHIWHHLEEGGIANIVLPHGVLFRNGSESLIRKWLVEQNALHALISLPKSIFSGTGIPTVIMILKKGREATDTLFIEACEEFYKGKNMNHMSDESIDKILSAYSDRKEMKKFASLVTIDEIRNNDFNLNVSRYVDISDDEEIIDLDDIAARIAKLEKEIDETTIKINKDIADLHPVAFIPVKGRSDVLKADYETSCIKTIADKESFEGDEEDNGYGIFYKGSPALFDFLG